MSGVPYHAWTHLPKAQGGTDPIEIDTSIGPYAVGVWEGSETAQDDTPVLIGGMAGLGFTYGYVSDPALMDVSLSLGRIYMAPDEGTSTLGGLWLAHLRVWYDAGFDGDTWGRIDWTMDSVFDGIDNVAGYQKAQNVIGGGTFATNSVSYTSIILVNDGADALNWVTGAFVQVSGGDEGFGYVSLYVHRLAPYPSDSGVELP